MGRSGRSDGEKTICYDEIGCFSTMGIFKHLKLLPLSPSKINTKFWLFKDKTNPRHRVSVNHRTGEGIEQIHCGQRLHIVAHGWTGSVDIPEIREVKNELLKNHKVKQVLVVDWRRGARLIQNGIFSYRIPAVNTQVVGRTLGAMLVFLHRHCAFDPLNLHLIGQSFGAHVMGFAARFLRQKIGLIVGRVTCELRDFRFDLPVPIFQRFSICSRRSRSSMASVQRPSSNPHHQGGCQIH